MAIRMNLRMGTNALPASLDRRISRDFRPMSSWLKRTYEDATMLMEKYSLSGSMTHLEVVDLIGKRRYPMLGDREEIISFINSNTSPRSRSEIKEAEQLRSEIKEAKQIVKRMFSYNCIAMDKPDRFLSAIHSELTSIIHSTKFPAAIMNRVFDKLKLKTDKIYEEAVEATFADCLTLDHETDEQYSDRMDKKLEELDSFKSNHPEIAVIELLKLITDLKTSTL
jgi:hypothetical protein